MTAVVALNATITVAVSSVMPTNSIPVIAITSFPLGPFVFLVAELIALQHPCFLRFNTLLPLKLVPVSFSALAR